MKKMSLLLILFITITFIGCNSNSTREDSSNSNAVSDKIINDSNISDVGKVFDDSDSLTKKFIADNNIDGTIVVSSLKTGDTHIINSDRAKQSFLPASTFKIPNTLIALEEKVIKDENEIIKWDGKDKGLQQWNKDHCLKTALPVSCVWFYQELAKRIGNETYLNYLESLDYGNKKTGEELDNFWLQGDIRISAEEQIIFLKNIYNEKFDFNERNYKILKDLLIEEKKDDYILSGKTGWALSVEPQIGWYIGYVEVEEDTWFFAYNMNIFKNADASYRKEIVRMYLEELKIIK